MKIEKKILIEEWYGVADKDLLAAKTVIEANPMLYDVAAFHCQQTAEKYLKAFIVFNETLPPKTHFIEELLVIAKTFDLSFSELDEAGNLSQYAINARCPHDLELDSKEQMMKILQLANFVKDFVRKKIGI